MALRMPGMRDLCERIGRIVRIVIVQTTTIASSKVGSMMFSTCPAGWRRSALSSPVISMPAAVRPAAAKVAVEISGANHRPALATDRGIQDAAMTSADQR